MKTSKKILNAVIEIIFALAYLLTIILAISDIFGWLSILETSHWIKILVMLFGTVGIVVLWDKRKLENDITPNIECITPIIIDTYPKMDIIENKQDKLKREVDSASQIIKNMNDIVSNDIDIKYFSDKTHFYLYLTHILLQLPNGSSVDVTNFEKNQDIPYDIGEDECIKTFMDIWNSSVKSNNILVRQLVHITTLQDYKELQDRVNQYENNHNFSISAIVGLPIIPYEDIMILNQEYIFIGLSNDASAPNNLSFGYAIKSKEMALEFRNYFNIYWSSQFSTIIKDKDTVKKKNLREIKNSVYEIDYNTNLKKYNKLALEVYHICERSSETYKLLKDLNLLYDNVFFEVIKKDVEEKIKEHSSQISQTINNFFEFDRTEAAELISRLIFNATDKIYASSLDIDGNNFWFVEEGEKVFQANLDVMIRKKVNIERIFICTQEKKKQLKKIIDKQIEVGIKIFYTEYKDRIGAKFEDFLIIDHNILLIFDNTTIKISINKNEIEKYYNKFVQIKKMGIMVSS